MVIGAVSSALYIVDAHRDIAIEAFTCMLLFKNFFSFGITWIAWDWFLEDGVWKTFRTVGLIQVLLTPLFYLHLYNPPPPPPFISIIFPSFYSRNRKFLD